MKKILLLILISVFAPFVFAQNSARQIELQNQFKKETGKYRMSVLYLMQVHDPRLKVSGTQAYRPPVREDDWAQLKTDLTELDGLCKTKYAGITDDPRAAADFDLDGMPATWCAIAAKHREYETRGRQLAAADQFNPILRGMLAEVQELLDNPQEFISEEIQLLMYERAKWRALQTPKFQKRFNVLRVQMPDDFFAEVEKKADELVTKNERDAPTRSFLMPKQKDATVEAFIRGRYATQKKGVQILKLGLDDAVWQIHRNGLGVPLSQTKVVRLLVKVPNRPFCQEHSVAVERKYIGGRLGPLTVEGNVGSEGLLMSCQ